MDHYAMRRAAMAAAVVVAGLGAMIPRAGAYSQYGTSSGVGNCATCHGDFRAATYTSLKGAAGGDWTNGLHDTHRNTMLSGDCTACHGSGPRFPVLTNSSASAAPFNTSCLGCHGRVEGAAGLTGRGLRAHHEKHGVSCFGCHGETTSSPVVAESVKPPLYIVDASHPNLPQDPCNPSPAFPENFAGTTLGLDNDGNDLYDGADPACVATAPVITLDPGTLSFGNVTVGATSAAMTSAVRNTGTATLTVTAIALCSSPATSAEFAFTSPALPFDVAPGSSATLSVTYAPTAVGTDTGCIAVTSNASNGPTSNLAVSGTGVAAPAPQIAVAPTSLAFGTVAVGTPSSQTFTISNQGTATLSGTIARASGTSAEFTFSPATFDVAAGGSQDVTATYTPADAGGDAGSLVVFSNDASNPSVSVAVSGTGVATPTSAIALEPTSLAFGAVLIGGSSSLMAQVRNVGTAALTVTSIALCGGTSGEYTWSAPPVPFAVAPGGSADLTVIYAPADAGTDSGCLAVSSDDPASPVVNLGVSGTGASVVAPAIAVTPAALGFGTVTIGSSATRTTQVRNDGNAVLQVSQIARCAGTTAEFAVSPATLTVAAGQSATLSVTYTPTDATSDAGCIALTHDAPGQVSPLEVPVTGAGGTASSGGCGCGGGSGTLGLAALALIAAVRRRRADRPPRGSGPGR